MPTELAFLALFFVVLFIAPTSFNTPRYTMIGVAVVRRFLETDAVKAERLIAKSQQLLEEARTLTAHAQQMSGRVNDEFERRLRLVSGEDKRERTD